MIEYDESEFLTSVAPDVRAMIAGKNSSKITWVQVCGIHDVEVVRRVGEAFDIHPLVLEDVLNTDQRPKLEDFGDYLFIAAKMLYFDAQETLLHAEQVSLVLGKRFVLSFQESDKTPLHTVLTRVQEGRGRIRQVGSDYLAYSLLDVVVDHYFGVLEALSEEIEKAEDELLSDPDGDTLPFLYDLKQEALALRKAVWPTRELVGALGRAETDLVNRTTLPYLRDLYDHVIQVIDSTENLRDTLSGLMDLYMSSISNRMNEIMKVLTIIATIFIPLTFLTSLYGMNFKYMPELGWPWGYPTLLGIMLAIGLGMLRYFRNRKWL
ncbi:MAG: magnesium/cobalt transporter CorA [Proteobacteria bacterium]|nr:magnesium/cobalt transporter CorA [Pseudomonadota bacterium]